MRFGDTLRSAREERGIALDDIALATRVSVRNLSALECERFRELPGGIFNRGIVRSYARCVGMNEDEAVSAFTSALRSQGVDPEHENDNWAEFAEAVKRGREPATPDRRLRWAGVFAMLLATLLVAVGVTVLLERQGIVHLPPRVERYIAPAADRPSTAADPSRSAQGEEERRLAQRGIDSPQHAQ